MKKKIWLALWALVMLLAALTPCFALGEARFPEDRGAVTDDANVLSEAMAKEIAEFEAVALARTGVKVRVAVIHFLDGLDAQTYANQLFDRWELGGNGFLLLAAVGEDSFAVASGENLKKTVSANNVQILLSTSRFGELLREREYEAAFGKFFAAFGQMLGKQFSVDMDSQNLFAVYQEGARPTPAPTATPAGSAGRKSQSFVSDILDGVRDGFTNRAEEYETSAKTRQRGGMSVGEWIFLAFLLLLVFGGGKAARRGRRIMGCGCGPLGWIFSLLGLGRFLGRRR